jgi:hypothetical protein
MHSLPCPTSPSGLSWKLSTRAAKVHLAATTLATFLRTSWRKKLQPYYWPHKEPSFILNTNNSGWVNKLTKCTNLAAYLPISSLPLTTLKVRGYTVGIKKHPVSIPLCLPSSSVPFPFSSRFSRFLAVHFHAVSFCLFQCMTIFARVRYLVS